MTTVMIVEDYPVTVSFLTQQLEQSGITVVSATTIEAAIQTFVDNQDDIDLIIMDGKLGQDETDKLVQIIRERGKFEGIILVASSNAEHSEKLVAAGATESVEKSKAATRAIELLKETAITTNGSS